MASHRTNANTMSTSSRRSERWHAPSYDRLRDEFGSSVGNITHDGQQSSTAQHQLDHTMEPSSSDWKGKDRAPEYAHLPEYRSIHRRRRGSPDINPLHIARVQRDYSATNAAPMPILNTEMFETRPISRGRDTRPTTVEDSSNPQYVYDPYNPAVRGCLEYDGTAFNYRRSPHAARSFTDTARCSFEPPRSPQYPEDAEAYYALWSPQLGSGSVMADYMNELSSQMASHRLADQQTANNQTTSQGERERYHGRREDELARSKYHPYRRS